MFQNLFGAIGHADRFATPENKWKTLFFPFLPSFWLCGIPMSESLLSRNVDPYNPRYWGAFVGRSPGGRSLRHADRDLPLFNILLRTQWSDHERLAFPIVQLPVAMTEEDGKGLVAGGRSAVR